MGDGAFREGVAAPLLQLRCSLWRRVWVCGWVLLGVAMVSLWLLCVAVRAAVAWRAARQ